MCPNVYCSMNIHQQQLTSWTANKADKPLERMLAENGLLTRWNNRKHVSVNKHHPDVAVNPIPEADNWKRHQYRTRNSTMSVWILGNC